MHQDEALRPADILPLVAAGRAALPAVGGKACNLGELLRAGFPVPRGFTVTTAAYAQAAQAARLEPLLVALAQARDSDIAGHAQAIRSALTMTPIDARVARAIVDAYTALGPAAAVAVRSSATAEDLATASFAGQQDTYLDIVGADAVLDAVRRCWASLWTERAVRYRIRAAIDPHGVRLAVVVQEMVHPRVAGVLFTANPVTGRRRQTVIDAAPGLGEAVVSGAVDPDHFVIDTATARVLSQRPGDTAIDGRPCLSSAELRALVRLGAQVEAHFAAPQDLEFAFDAAGHLWLTQSRPITTLFPLPDGVTGTGADDLRVYASATADEGVSGPITPMGLQAFRLLAGAWGDLLWNAAPAERTAGPRMVVETAFRTYYDVTPIVRSSLGRRIARTLLPMADAHSAALFGALDADRRLAPQPTRLASALRAVIVPLVRTRLPVHLVSALVDPARTRHRNRAWIDALLARSTMATASLQERLDQVEELLWTGGRALPITGFFEPLAGVIAFELAKLLVRGPDAGDTLEAAMRGLPHSTTVALTLDLWQLGQAIAADEPSARALRQGSPAELTAAYRQGTLPAPLQQGLARYLEHHGHRAVAEVDLGLARWAEDPTYLFSVLAGYLRGDARTTPDTQRRRAVEEGEQAVATLVKDAGVMQRALLRWLLGRARDLSGVREQWKDDLTRLWTRARTLLWPVGEGLVSAGRLAQAGDIFFLSLVEARSALAGQDLRALVRERREAFHAEQGRRHVPALYLSDGTEPDIAAARAGSGALQGTGASPGKVRARARVLLDPTGAQLEPGEVLVAPSTDPGWTPLFMTAGGLVMERGGVISHGAVIAREYGIPAVVGVAGALQRIQTGQWLEVDGAAGTVALVDPGEQG